MTITDVTNLELEKCKNYKKRLSGKDNVVKLIQSRRIGKFKPTNKRSEKENDTQKSLIGIK